MSKDEHICTKCKRPRISSNKGSITQWISACTCVFGESNELETLSVEFCKNCGKRIQSGRSGSLTQQIFRSDLCECTRSLDPVENSNSAVSTIQPNKINPVEEITELEPGSESFPKERYRALRVLGEGVSGTVYLAVDRLLDKTVAVKVLRLNDPQQLISFQNEAKTLTKLAHPAIVDILDFGVSQSGTPYMVLEFIDGISLDTILRSQGTFNWQESLRIFRNICTALSYAHSKNIFHRDIKPSNILLHKNDNDEFEAKLIDFGISILKSSSLEPTIVDGKSVIGTPAYMCPEQIASNSYDQRSEIYSLACALFESITGAPPFVGETALQTLSMHAKKSPPALSSNAAGVIPQELDTVIAKCLEKKPENRYKSVNELIGAFEEINCESEFEIAPQVDKLPPPPTVLPRKRAILFSALLAIVVLGTVVSLLYTPTKIENKDVKPEKNPKKIEIKKWKFNKNKHLLGGKNIDDDDFALVQKHSKAISLTCKASNKITGTGLKYVKQLPLRAVFIESSAFNDDGARELSKLTSIRSLLLGKLNKMTDRGYAEIGTMKNLINLEFRGCRLTDDALLPVSKLHLLEELSFNSSEPINQNQFKLFATSLPNLTGLAYTGTPVTDTAIEAISKMKNLKKLYLISTVLNDAQTKKLASTNLVFLDISSTNVTDKGLIELSKIKTLTHLTADHLPLVTVNGLNEFAKRRPKCTLRVFDKIPSTSNKLDDKSQLEKFVEESH